MLLRCIPSMEAKNTGRTNEDLLTRHTALTNGVAYLSFVTVHARGIDVPEENTGSQHSYSK